MNFIKGIHFILILCFLFVPLIIWPSHLHLYEAIKEFMFTFFVLISVGLLVIFFIVNNTITTKRNRLTFAVIVYYVYNLISFMVLPYTDRDYFFLFSCLIALFFIISSITNNYRRDQILQALIIVAMLISVYSIFQFFGIDFVPFLEKQGGRLSFGRRVFATFGNPILLGGFCVCMLPIISAFTVNSIRKNQRVYMGSMLMLLFGSLIMSQTRGSWIGSVCSLGIFCMFWKGRHFLSAFGRYKARIGLLTIAIFLVCIFGISVMIRSQPLLADLRTVSYRLNWYKETIVMIKEHPIWGRGFGTFKVIYPLYQDNRTSVKLGEPNRDEYIVNHPHNEHLEILNDTGVIGYGLFLWIIIETLFLLLQKHTVIEQGIAAALLGLLCDGLFSHNLRQIVISSLFWLMVGFANIHYTDGEQLQFYPSKNNSTPKKRFQYSSSRKKRFAKIIGILLVILWITFSLRSAYEILQVEQYFSQIDRYYYGTPNPDPQRIIDLFSLVLSLAPYNEEALYNIAYFHKMLHQNDKAIVYYTKLLERNPNCRQVNFLLAELYFENNDLEKTKYYCEKEIAVNNMHWQAYYNLALLELQSNNSAKALRYLKEIEKIHLVQNIEPNIFIQVKQMLSQLSTQER